MLPKILQRYKDKKMTEEFRRLFESIKVIFWGYTGNVEDVSICVQFQSHDEEKAHLEETAKLSDILSGVEEVEQVEVNSGDAIVVEGYRQLIELLVNASPMKGPNCGPPLQVNFRKVVNKIEKRLENEREKFTVSCEDGTILQADYVVVTVPLGVLQKGVIQFEPNLSDEKLEAISKLGMGAENKIVLQFPKSFWPQEAYIQCTDPRFRFLNLDAFGKKGIIVCHVSPPFSLTLGVESDQKILEQVVTVLKNISLESSVFTVQQLLEQIENYHITKWHLDPFAYGSYSFLKVGSSLVHVQKLANPEGNLYFAGESCSTLNMQCVQGAYTSGKEAAQDIVLKNNEHLNACPCGKSVESTLKMFECDRCFQWYHEECGLVPKKIVEHGFTWYCPNCSILIPKKTQHK